MRLIGLVISMCWFTLEYGELPGMLNDVTAIIALFVYAVVHDTFTLNIK